MHDPKWRVDVDEHDYQAALDYLTILLDEERARKAVHALVHAPLTRRRANDILRGCHRNPLPDHDPGVEKTMARIRREVRLSPILVVSFTHGGDIADGFHRVSAVYQHDPFAKVPCKLAHVPDLAN